MKGKPVNKAQKCSIGIPKPYHLLQALGDPLIDSVVSESIPLLTADEKYNETVYSIARRVGAVLNSEIFTAICNC